MVSCNNLSYELLLSYTKQLTSHVNKSRHQEALSLFHHLHSSTLLDPFVFPLALKSCAVLHRPLLGATIHAHISKSALLSNPFVASALVDFYGKCVSLHSARKMFDEITVRNVVVWNSMMSLYSHSGSVSAALELFDAMDLDPNPSTFNSIIAGMRGKKGIDDEVGSYRALAFYRKMQGFGLRANLITLLAVLPACGNLGSLNLIKEVHGFSIRFLIDPNPQLRSCLVEAYGKCGFLGYADYIFHSMERKDVVAWSSLISAYAVHGEARKALDIFQEMEQAEIRPDEITFLSVLKACTHAGMADEAKVYFARMEECYGIRTTSDHYSCLVDALGRAGRLSEAYEVIRGMPMKATAKTWGALLSACRTHGDIELGEIAGRTLFEIEPDNVANYIILARIYADGGRNEEASRVRRDMEDRGMQASPRSSWVVKRDKCDDL